MPLLKLLNKKQKHNNIVQARSFEKGDLDIHIHPGITGISKKCYKLKDFYLPEHEP